MLGLLTVVDATTVPNREVKEAIAVVFEALTAAYNDLRTLGELVGRGDAPATEITAAYSGFYLHLWRAYKDRFQRSVPPALGCDIGFNLCLGDQPRPTGLQLPALIYLFEAVFAR